MKSFQPKDSTVPPPDDDPGGPPPPPNDETSASTSQPQETETQPMPDTPRQTRNAEVNFRGEKRSNATHASMTDPDARLHKKSPGAGATLCFMGHTLMENRNGLVVQADLTHADGHGERKAALEMINRHSPGSTRRLTLGADKGYDAASFVAELRRMVVTPHIAQKARHSAIDERTTRHAGYAVSQRCRKKIDLRRENDPPDRFLVLLTVPHDPAVAHLLVPGVEDQIPGLAQGPGAPGLQFLVEQLRRAADLRGRQALDAEFAHHHLGLPCGFVGKTVPRTVFRSSSPFAVHLRHRQHHCADRATAALQ
jgi:hypothetical protein